MSYFGIPQELHSTRILVTNDDGVHAEGIQVLADIMREFSDDVWIVAPEVEQSGAGHSLTLHQPLRARQLEQRRFAVSGTPTDCVLLAVKDILPNDKKVGLIVSGVNHGDNMAENVTYSGTIAATMEGTLLGYPSVAFSRAIFSDAMLEWDTTKEAIRQVISYFRGFAFEPDSLLSVNIPDCCLSQLREVRVAEQGRRSGIGDLDARYDPRGRRYYWIGGTVPHGTAFGEQTDCALLEQQHTTVTPIKLNLTDYTQLDRMRLHLEHKAGQAA